jgi:hypothetical protein
VVAADISGCGGGITIPILTEARDGIEEEGGMRRHKPLAHMRRTLAVHLCTPLCVISLTFANSAINQSRTQIHPSPYVHPAIVHLKLV